MPDGAPRAIDPDDLLWHDGNLVDLQLTGLAGDTPQNVRLTVDLYPSNDPKARRQRHVCVGRNLLRFAATGDVARLVRRGRSQSSSAGNIDFARIDYTENTEILVVLLFGGMIEAEASRFEFTEALS